MTSHANIKRLSTLDGMFYCLMVGTGETFLVAFAINLGVTEWQAALLGIVPIVVGSVLQLSTYRVTTWVGSLKKMVVGLALAQAMLIGIAGLAALPPMIPFAFPFLMVVSSIYWATALAAGPPWNSWIAELIPIDDQKDFFIRRSIALQVATIIALFFAGYYLDVFGHNPWGFARLFFLAFVARCISSWYLFRHPEIDSRLPSPMKFRAMGTWLKQRVVKFGFAYVMFLNVGVFVSAPFFVPYMLSELKLDLMEFTVLIAIAFAARTLAGPVFRNYIRSHGVQVMFWVGYLMIVPLPWYWTLTDDFWWLFLFQILSGLAWGAQELGLTLMLLETMPNTERSKLLSLNNFGVSMGMLIGTMIGSWIIGSGDITQKEYFDTFNYSSLVRIIPLFLIFGFIRSVKGDAPPLRVLGVRPGGLGITRPLLRRKKKEPPIPSE